MRTLRRSILLALSLGLAACAATPSRPAPVSSSPPLAAPAKCTDAPAPKEPTKRETSARAKTPEEAIARLFTTSKSDAAWFTETFVTHVSTQKVDAIVEGSKQQLGAFSKVEERGGALYAVMAKGRIAIKIALDAEGRIASLWFSPPEPTEAPSHDEIAARLRALPGKVAFLVITDGKDVLAHEADTPMAVGSAFKLAILDALRTKIDARKAQWTDVVRLEARHKSLPSGELRRWPDRSPLTLHTAAALMISQSDNTATDVLLDYVGRDAVEKLAPGNAPFLSTRDAFVLKARANRSLLERWRAADAGGRRAMLPELQKTNLGDGDFGSEPTIDVEWTFSARRLCELMSRTKVLDVTRINPGLASKKDWDLVAYKGGSEPGVLEYTSWVEKGDARHCVVTTWNDPSKDVDEGKLSSLHSALLLALRDGPRR